MTMENGAVHDEQDVEPMVMELESEYGTLEVTSFTDSIDELYESKSTKAWPNVESALEKHGLSGTLNLVERCITVSTTTRTRDPDIIYRARDCIVLLSKTKVPAYKAIRVLNGKLSYDYIKIGYQEGGLAAIHQIRKPRFVRKVKRLRQNIKDIGKLLECSIYVSKDSVSATGITPLLADIIRRIVKRCIVDNVNPATLVKGIDRILQMNRLGNELEDLHV